MSDLITEFLGGVMGAIAEIARRMGEGEGLAITAGTFIAMVLAERLIYLFDPDAPHFNNRDFTSNAKSQAVSAVIDGLVGTVLFVGVYTVIYENFRLFQFQYSALTWLCVFLLNDLRYYLDHRLAHRVGALWALHFAHHSSQEMTLIVANRNTALSFAKLMEPMHLVLAFLGVPLPMLLAVNFFGNLWGIFNHTRLVKRMGWLDILLCTPSVHRVHHGIEPKYLDRNYGQVLLLWDHLFGTYQREEEEPTYGLTDRREYHSVLEIQTGGVQWLWNRLLRSPKWAHKVMYLLMPPGWSHDGRHERSEDLLRHAELG